MTKPQRKRPGATSTLAPNVEAINVGNVRPQTAETPKAEAAPVKVPAKKAVTVRLDTELIGQAQAAVLDTQAQAGGYTSFNALVETAIRAEVEKAAQQFNQGKAFRTVDGQFRRGRPLQSN